MSEFRRKLMMAYAANLGRGDITYPGLIAAWSAKGKTNDDEDRAILKDLTGNGHDITLNGFAFSEMSGYGGYSTDFNKWYFWNGNSPLYETEYTFKTITCNIGGGSDYALYNSISRISRNLKLKITGFTENNAYLFIGVSDFGFKCEDGDGEYIFDVNEYKTLYPNNRDIGFKVISKESGIVYPIKKRVTIEILPEYPDALVFDGVDDYGINENMPILTDYTIIAKRKWITWISSSAFISKRVSNNYGAFIFEKSKVNAKCFTSSFNEWNANNVEFEDLDISWQNKNSYNCQDIKSGDLIDTNTFLLGTGIQGNERLNCAFYSAYLFDRSLDEQEIKEFIRKYIDPEYLLPSEIPTPDCYYDFSLGSNDDENRETIKDQSGNGNDAKAHNIAWAGMSGYGGYILFNNVVSTDNVNIYNGKLIIKNVPGESNLRYVETTDGTRIVLHITGIPQGAKVIARSLKGNHFETSEDGTYIIENTGTVVGIAVLDFTGECNIEITEEPQYPGALVFDGVDDYVKLEAFDSGFKTVFMLCSWKIENVINYDQRNNNDYENALNTSSQDINYYGRNRSGKTYINGILSTKVKNNLTRNKKHLITGTFFGGSNTTTPCIGSNNSGNGYFSNLTLYKFLGFKEELTEEQIKAIIKKYNLLDGVDEIEVS